jgi:hypothetical protein
MNARFLFATLLASTVLTGCTDQVDDDSFGEAESNLSSAGWATAPSYVWEQLKDHGYGSPPAMAVLNGARYWVYTWEEGGGVTGIHDLYWSKCTATCTAPARISDQESLGRPSIAAFNGYLYMVHQGDSDSTAVWFSRFDPNSNRWTNNSKLPFTTYGGSPALATFNNQLVMVGSQQVGSGRTTTYPLWFSSMGANEQWSPAQPVANEESVSSPSLAVLSGTLYLAHRWGQTPEIVMQHLPTGGAWSAVQHIPAGPSNANITGNDVQLAVVNGYLHLIHHRSSGSNDYWWTYNRGCDAFAPEITVPDFGHSTQSTLAASSSGLYLSAFEDLGFPPLTINYLYQAHFTAPAAPIQVPSCSIHGIGGLGLSPN